MKLKILALVLLIATFSCAAAAQTRLNINWWAISVPVTVATLPGSPFTGQIAMVTDGTGGTPCATGGGSAKALCVYNGSSWDSYSAVIGAGTITATGSPASTRCAVFSGAATITGTADCVFSAGALSLGAAATSTGVINLLGSTSGTLSITPNSTATTVTLGGALAQFSLPAGSAGTPVLSFGGDTTTGFYRNAANQISLSVSGTQNILFAGSAIILGSGYTIRGLAAGSAVTYSASADANSSGVTRGTATLRGADTLGGATTGEISGSVAIRGGDNAATGNAEEAGDVTLRTGHATSATPAIQKNGRYSVDLSGIKGGTYNTGNLGCMTTSGAAGFIGTISDCSGAGTTHWVGINQAADGNAAVFRVQGISAVNSGASVTWTVGDNVCVDGTNPAVAVDNGGTACAAGAVVGQVTTTDGGNTTSHWVLITR